MGELKFGPARIPSRESPEAAIELLLEGGYSACEIDFEGRFWMDYDFAARLGEALPQFERPATVITESPDEESNQAIRAALFASTGESSAQRSSNGAASSGRPRSRRN